MKNLNKKGFILVETLIVTVFVVTMFIVVYQSTLPILGDFEQYSKYEDIDSIYNANIYRQMLSKYGNLTIIDKYFNEHIYLDITNCDGKINDIPIYLSPSYCHLVQSALKINREKEVEKNNGKDVDKIILTDYDISAFKSEVNDNADFDSGIFSNFRDYVNLVSNTEPFYQATNGKIGKYRLFVIKNTINTDGSKSRKYANLGMYDGINKSYVMGEEVIVNNLYSGAGPEKFYVLKNSNSYDTKVTLIYSKNLPSSNVAFSYGTTSGTLYNKLKTGTDSWNVSKLIDTAYYSKFDNDTTDNYKFDYSGNKARLLDEYDIYEALGCKNDAKECFDPDNAFLREIDNEKFKFLTDGLEGEEGYWTATTVPYTNIYAWSIKKGRIVPALRTDTTNIGIRPVIVIDKSKISRKGEE